MEPKPAVAMLGAAGCGVSCWLGSTATLPGEMMYDDVPSPRGKGCPFSSGCGSPKAPYMLCFMPPGNMTGGSPSYPLPPTPRCSRRFLASSPKAVRTYERAEDVYFAMVDLLPPQPPMLLLVPPSVLF